MKKLVQRSIKNRLISGVVALTIIMVVALILLNNYTIEDIVETTVNDKLEGDHEMGLRVVENNFSGNWHILGDELYKGNVTADEMTGTLDNIQESTGSVATIFKGDTSVASNLTDSEGERAIGTQVDEEVSQTVLEEGERFTGQIEILGTPHEVMYSPIENPEGEEIGIWFTGVPIDDVNNLINQGNMSFIFFSSIIIIIALILFYIAINKIVKPIKGLTSLLDKFSTLDLSSSEEDNTNSYLKRSDEIGKMAKAMMNMQEAVVQLIKNINDKSNQVTSSAEELSANAEENTSAANEVSKAVEEIAQGATSQAEKTDQSSNVTEELGKIIEKEQSCVDSLNQAIEEVTNKKEEGTEAVKNLHEKTNETNSAIKEITEVIEKTHSRTQEIKEASSHITDIAEQTNLLALNASIEAARAGEHGQGFAVVANEIRQLAEKSNEYSENILNNIDGLNKQANDAVKTMENVKQIIKEQSVYVEETGSKFDGISNAIEGVESQLSELNEFGKEMNNKKQEIINALQDLSSIAEENSSSTEEISSTVEEQTASMDEIASASEQLTKLAEEMQEEINKFSY
ncbi:methyl-accepting chemotaxis protein [Natranaerobius thermophilus]|uniref:Methyl-accepting chemotaxis sensory transducer n=1 Tax=Natranaerobius thermophilus (strain ATCC BAA-1301 / DSM 18059 / JW/NM-WN-LF) TaxID=457570 RepID=B2A177_NATTJ|nr:methyl-accepting chemotaxis protein [Natranaerobius thermophilus]ACB86018.1 methyl-accepting chemotaxis sensory transducer [Natranaerobius thermophilus JW/NM-WN-LF]